MAPKKDYLRAREMKELQSVVAYKVLEYLYSKGNSRKKVELQADLFDIYHGNAAKNQVSFASMAFNAQNPFDTLFETVETTCPDAVGGTVKQIPTLLHRDPSKNLILGKTITRQHLGKSTISGKSSALVSGLTLWRRVDEHVLRNNKKAVAYGKDYFNSNGAVPTGGGEEDYLNFVLDKMWEHECKNKNKAVSVDDDDDDSDDGDNEGETRNRNCEERPFDWYFPGFWVLALMGPMAPMDRRSPLFNIENLDELCKGRKEIRKEEADRKRKERDGAINASSALGVDGDKRGLGLKERSTIVHLSQQQRMADTRDDELEFETISKRIDSIQARINSKLNIAKQLGITNEEHQVFKDIVALEEKMDALSDELDAFQAAKKAKKADNKESSLASFLGGVSTVYNVNDTTVSPSTPKFFLRLALPPQLLRLHLRPKSTSTPFLPQALPMKRLKDLLNRQRCHLCLQSRQTRPLSPLPRRQHRCNGGVVWHRLASSSILFVYNRVRRGCYRLVPCVSGLCVNKIASLRASYVNSILFVRQPKCAAS
jgi:hypothetical protein